MKPGTTEQLLRIAAANIPQRDEAADKLAGIVPSVDSSELKRLTDEGYLNAYTVTDENNTAHYVFWVTFTPDRGCRGEYVVQLTQQTPGLAVLASCLEEIARSKNCKYIRFNSFRLGYARAAKQLGYRIESLSFHKFL